MNLQPSGLETIYGQKQFLRNSVGLEYKTGGATLDHEAFAGSDVVNDEGYVLAGTAVYRDADSGLYVPWEDEVPAEEGDPETMSVNGNRQGAGLTAHDVKIVEGSNAIVGVLVAGHPLESKCHGVTDGFKEAVRGYLRFDA